MGGSWGGCDTCVDSELENEIGTEDEGRRSMQRRVVFMLMRYHTRRHVVEVSKKEYQGKLVMGVKNGACRMQKDGEVKVRKASLRTRHEKNFKLKRIRGNRWDHA